MAEYRANKVVKCPTDCQSTFRKEVSSIFSKVKAKNPDMNPKSILPKVSKIASFKTNPKSNVSKEQAEGLMDELGI